MPFAEDPALAVLWGKSKAGPRLDPRPNLLLQHLLDTAAVGEVLWDRWLASSVRARIDECCAGQGRLLFAVLCGLHDVGKATPAFQSKDASLAVAVRGAGLTWGALDNRSRAWHHTLAGAVIVRRVLVAAGWEKSAVRWVWPLIAGHHGVMPGLGRLAGDGPKSGQGTGPLWPAAQDRLVAAVIAALGANLTSLTPRSRPRRADQLALSGAIIMADWIASGSSFSGVTDIHMVSMTAARERAEQSWQRLGLHGGWSSKPYLPVPDLVLDRFDRPCRQVQRDAITLAEHMPAPGLMMIEAPMGEGKTEAALVAAEILARRFGANGIYVGMPTQATSDPMFTRVRTWAQRVQADTPVGLLHGKRRFNREWRVLVEGPFADIDDLTGDGDPYGCVDPGPEHGRSRQAPAEWFLGPKKGLLMPVVVGTVDHLLYAATRTRHVMLRHAGLAGRVVILDEIHAYDVYMQQFLAEALRWLADAGVPVILLSATLPPALRRQLAAAYAQGASLRRDVDLPIELDADDGYPVVRSVWVQESSIRYDVMSGKPWRESLPVGVEILPEVKGDGPERVVSLLQDALADGGCALVVRNTVARAQRTYEAVKAEFGDDVRLLHARLTAADRADRSRDVLDLLGPPSVSGDPARPRRLVVVATQVAEQSFDIDVDLLVTDLAPIDLLLQRVGRLHRHTRADGARPPRVAAPRVVVTGMRPRPDGPPSFITGSQKIYRKFPLLRAAYLVMEAAGGPGWSVPGDVPDLVRRGYDDALELPVEWQDAADGMRKAFRHELTVRAAKADKFLLAGEDQLGRTDLEGLHDLQSVGAADDDEVAAVVRDGPESVEVILVRRDESGYRTLDGRSIGTGGSALHDPKLLEAVVNTALRLPAHHEHLTEAAKAELRALPECGDDPWLRGTPALVLDRDNSATLGGRRLTYHRDLGLVDEPAS